MGFSKIHSAQITFLQPHIIDIEVDITNGLHSFTIVGLANKAVDESRDRVSAAIKNSGFTSPKQKNQKVVISLAPADLKKEGPIFDLPIAIAYLHASENISFDTHKKLFIGELSLDGEVRKISGIIPIVQEAQKRGFSEIYIPYDNKEEAALVQHISVFPVRTLKEIVEHLEHTKSIHPQQSTTPIHTRLSEEHTLEDILGQENAKRGLEISAAGGHSIVLYGPPGAGKTMLAKSLRTLLPPLSFEEVLEVTTIHSVAGTLRDTPLVTHPPFRSPHHTSSRTALVGGGALLKPGEITLAHRGVLFLDEFAEFDRAVIESLREPLEEKRVRISRARGTVSFPAHCILVATMNPCPCGYKNVKDKECVCSPVLLSSYSRKMSGPIMDRIDMWIHVEPVAYQSLLSDKKGGREKETVAAERTKKILQSRAWQKHRYHEAKLSIQTNSELPNKKVGEIIPLQNEVELFLNKSAESLGLSARAYYRVWKIARTIADLEQSQGVTTQHILEALHYRPKNI